MVLMVIYKRFDDYQQKLYVNKRSYLKEFNFLTEKCVISSKRNISTQNI